MYEVLAVVFSKNYNKYKITHIIPVFIAIYKIIKLQLTCFTKKNKKYFILNLINISEKNATYIYFDLFNFFFYPC